MFQRKIQKCSLWLPAIAAMAFISCGSNKNDIADFERDKQEMRTEIQNAIARIDSILDTTEVKIDTPGQEASSRYNSVRQDLWAHKSMLEQRLSDLDNTAQDQWKKFKANAADDINKAYNKIRGLDSSQTKKPD